MCVNLLWTIVTSRLRYHSCACAICQFPHAKINSTQLIILNSIVFAIPALRRNISRRNASDDSINGVHVGAAYAHGTLAVVHCAVFVVIHLWVTSTTALAIELDGKYLKTQITRVGLDEYRRFIIILNTLLEGGGGYRVSDFCINQRNYTVWRLVFSISFFRRVL